MPPFSSFFARPSEAISADGWTRRELRGGEYLWRQDSLANAIAWTASGELRVVVDGSQRGSVGAGSLLGEASMFTRGERRTADVQATKDASVYVLEQPAFLEHQRKGTALYDALLLEAARTLSERIVENEAEVSRRNAGDHDDVAGGRPLRPDRPPAGVPTAVQALAALPRLRDVSPAVLVELASAGSPLLLQPGDILCRQGESAGSMFVLAEGELTVRLRTSDGKAREIATVSVGSLLGTTALFNDGLRTATLIANESASVWEFPRAEIASLGEQSWRVLVESLLVVMRGQLQSADRSAILSRGARGTIPLEDSFGALQSLHVWQGATMGDVRLEHLPAPGPALELDEETTGRIDLVRRSVVGSDVALSTPFGEKRVVYADYTASGRSLSFIEDYLRDQVMPLYANTHTEASASGRQTTHFREEARQLVARGVGATERDAVIFTGSGATGAIDRLVGILNIRLPDELESRYSLARSIPAHERPVVFIGPYEHHSNILSWKHTIADVVVVPLDAEGQLDTKRLEELLEAHADRPLKIGSFSAASNVTGIKADTIAVATLLHRHGALSFWDYAAAGPYVEIDMNPSGPGIDETLAHKDAVFLSPHKFVGGPGTPGVLVLKRDLAQNRVPAVPGGGTVDFVTWDTALYTDDVEAREEGGTPAIIESIRCGLVFHLKAQIGAPTIEAIEHDFTRRAALAWGANPAIDLVGNPDADRLSITAFMVRHGRRYLHYGFVVALLNDLFGVQARGGCSCAGPYGAMLLGLSQDAGAMFLERASEGWMALKPGWSRVNFNYFIGEREFRYIIDAVHLVALHGWALMPRYDFDPASGLWTHRGGATFRPARLSDLSIDGGEAVWGPSWSTLPEVALERQLAEGRAILEAALREQPPSARSVDVPPEYHDGRWFPLPGEAAQQLIDRQGGGLRTEG